MRRHLSSVGCACATSVLGVQYNRCLIAFIAGVYHERQFDSLLSRGRITWFDVARIRDSVILVVEGSLSYAMRALESIQNQDLYDL